MLLVRIFGDFDEVATSTVANLLYENIVREWLANGIYYNPSPTPVTAADPVTPPPTHTHLLEPFRESSAGRLCRGPRKHGSREPA